MRLQVHVVTSSRHYAVGRYGLKWIHVFSVSKIRLFVWSRLFLVSCLEIIFCANKTPQTSLALCCCCFFLSSPNVPSLTSDGRFILGKNSFLAGSKLQAANLRLEMPWLQFLDLPSFPSSTLGLFLSRLSEMPVSDILMYFCLPSRRASSIYQLCKGTTI